MTLYFNIIAMHNQLYFTLFLSQARQQAQMRHQMASDSKNEYSSYLQKFNQEQNEHYYTIIPNIFQVLTCTHIETSTENEFWLLILLFICMHWLHCF